MAEEDLANAVPPPPHANPDVNSQEWRTWFYRLRDALVAPVIIERPGGGGGGDTVEDTQALTNKNYNISTNGTIPADAHVVCADSSSGDLYLTLPTSPESRYIHIKKISNDLNDVVIQTQGSALIDNLAEVKIRFLDTNIMLLKTTNDWKIL